MDICLPQHAFMARDNPIFHASNPHIANLIDPLSAPLLFPTDPLHMPFGYVRSHNAPHHIDITLTEQTACRPVDDIPKKPNMACCANLWHLFIEQCFMVPRSDDFGCTDLCREVYQLS